VGLKPVLRTTTSFSALTLLVGSFDSNKTVPEMTYNVFSGTLNPAESKAFGPCEPTTQTAPQSVQPSLHRRSRSVSIRYNGLPVSLSKLSLPMLASGPHVIRGSLGPPESGTQLVT